MTVILSAIYGLALEQLYQWGNWHDKYRDEATPNQKWVDIVTDPQEAARKREAE
jgi:hypothetical protein